MAGTSGSPAAKGVPLQEDARTGAPAPGAPLNGPGAGAPATGATGPAGASPAAPLASGTGLRLSGVARVFGQVVAVSGVDLEVPLHSRLSIVGPSGCGKSTLLGLISGLDEPSEGTIDVLGATSSAERLRRCAWMPQRDLLLPWRDVLGNAALALENQGVRRRAARQRVGHLVERFGLAGFEEKLPYQLSGGMRQRVSFLRTLVAGKEVLLLDEPFGALDSITRADLQEWLRTALDAEPRTTVLVTHDVEEALLIGERVVVMSARPGRIRAQFEVHLPAAGSRRELIRHPEFAELRDEILSLLEAVT
ncbi:MAG: ABC transporter ATP-binding protein [Streptosporangiaceae bacterium]|jgi:NitT/TauT family transport system ATP-binding protein